MQFSLPTFSWDGDLSVANTGMNGKDDVDDDDDDNVSCIVQLCSLQFFSLLPEFRHL